MTINEFPELYSSSNIFFKSKKTLRAVTMACMELCIQDLGGKSEKRDRFYPGT